MRRGVVIAALLGSTACKVVHSTAGADGGETSGLVVGFTNDTTRVGETAGTFDIPVTMDGTSSSPVTVTYRALDQTAQAGVDYSVSGTTLTFPPGEAASSIPVAILGDSSVEDDESFVIELSSAAGAELGRTEHTVTIAKNGIASVSFESAMSSAAESVPDWVAVELDQPSSQPITVTYSVGGTATPGVDYQVLSGTLTIPPGSTRELIAISQINDSLDEVNETIDLSITQVAGGLIGPANLHSHTIVDDDAPPSVSFSPSGQTVNEGNAGTTLVSIPLVLSAVSAKAITLPFSVDTTSTANASDYTILTASPLQIPPGASSATIMVAVNGDTTLEGVESVRLQLGAPTNATLTWAQTYALLIGNDDCVGTGAFAVCPDAPLADAVTLSADLFTDNNALCVGSAGPSWSQAGQPAACVVFARSITVGSTRAWGSRPLVLVATDTITITGSLDASAYRGYNAPGANTALCNAPLTMPGSRAGGPGGSFMTAGGNGGAHTNPTSAACLAGAAETTPPAILRGGCPGTLGGDNFSPSTFGGGGGAVYLVAAGSIVLAPGSIINASGDGAAAGVDASNGGSGGGSGGMIVLDAPMITATSAFVVANGGGGAQGGDVTRYGASGAVPDPTSPFTAASGGAGNGGGAGGSGFAQGSPATSGASTNNNNGAGGGGGGAGFIRSSQPLSGASVSPTAP